MLVGASRCCSARQGRVPSPRPQRAVRKAQGRAGPRCFAGCEPPLSIFGLFLCFRGELPSSLTPPRILLCTVLSSTYCRYTKHFIHILKCIFSHFLTHSHTFSHIFHIFSPPPPSTPLQVESLARSSNSVNNSKGSDNDRITKNGGHVADQCPNCGYIIDAPQHEEEVKAQGHHHFLTMSTVPQSEHAILSIEKRLADESQVQIRGVDGWMDVRVASVHGRSPPPQHVERFADGEQIQQRLQSHQEIVAPWQRPTPTSMATCIDSHAVPNHWALPLSAAIPHVPSARPRGLPRRVIGGLGRSRGG